MREVGNRAGEAATLNNIGPVYDGLGERQRALDYYGQALPIRREVGDRAGEAATLNNIGGVYAGLGDRQRALAYYQQALPILREVGDRAGEAATLNNIGAVYRGLGDPQRALEYFQQALPIPREVGDRAGEADHPEQHRPRIRRFGGSAAGPGLFRAGAADRAGGRGPGRQAITLNNIGLVNDGLG